MAASGATREGLARETQSSLTSDSASNQLHDHTPHSTSYMATANLDTSTWLPPNVRRPIDQQQHAMLEASDIAWASEYPTEALFPNSPNYELCQQSILSPGKNGLHMGSYFDFQMLNEQGFEGWSVDNSTLVQPRSIPGLDMSSMTQSSDGFPPSAFHVDTKSNEASQQIDDASANAALLDIHLSVEQDPLHTHRQDSLLDLGSSELQLSYANDFRRSHHHSPTPMHSEFSGGHDEHIEFDDVEEDNEKPYAQLIWQALKSAPDYSMQLQDIYDYVQHSTDKVKDKSGNGWRNSIRHNLSMNKAFEKTTSDSKSKKGGKNTWRLVPEFIECGPESTTRYRRKDPTFKRPRKSMHPAPQRQASGAKGGQAARKAAEQRRSMRLREAQTTQLQEMRAFDAPLYNHSPRMAGDQCHGLPYYAHSPQPSSEPHSAFASYPSSPYFTCSPSIPQGFSFAQAPATAPKSDPFALPQAHGLPQEQLRSQYHFQQIDGFPTSMPAPYTPPHDHSSYTNTPPAEHVDRIELIDIGDKPLFASECDTSDSASEMNSPLTPATMGSTERFGGIPSGIGIDPSPFDGSS
ncbi:hypothetical protein NA57DRAFT_79120 [Rhizodiscina lignyota]|uniref:Fork-head domain-containing protein n=1 Tax=Rhizodiscina lignyota TaxID=1504668 RepID=A0A9P4I585_9PEZI|nr:hypothetical protein NA57DRAFT_79120 [Rhizodiscina lignyota]